MGLVSDFLGHGSVRVIWFHLSLSSRQGSISFISSVCWKMGPQNSAVPQHVSSRHEITTDKTKVTPFSVLRCLNVVLTFRHLLSGRCVCACAVADLREE